MTIEQSDQQIDVEALWKDHKVQRIRQRSRVPFRVLRQRKLDELSKMLGEAITLEEWFGSSHPPSEDDLRDSVMATSEDILDLHLSELKDWRIFGPGVHSPRTEGLATRVAIGFVWATDNDPSMGSGLNRDNATDEYLENVRFRTKAKNLRTRLLSTDTSQRIIAIHQMLGLDHNEALNRTPVRDLYWERIEETHKFLNFLRDEIR